MKHKKNDPMCDPWDSQGNEEMQFLFLLLFCLDFFIRNENITSEECTTKHRDSKNDWRDSCEIKMNNLEFSQLLTSLKNII